MFCPRCGKEHSEKGNFCCYCGASLAAGASKPNKKLMRSRSEKKVAGVCGGFAEYLDMDVTLVRIIWVMLAVFGGCGILCYVIAWIVMPEEPGAQALAKTTEASAPQPAPNHGVS
jgi:phage shock protein C